MAVRMLICRKLYILQCMSYLRNTCRNKYACRQGDSYLNFLTEIKQSESAVYASCRIGFARFTTIACLQNISYYTTIVLGNQKIHLGFVILSARHGEKVKIQMFMFKCTIEFNCIHSLEIIYSIHVLMSVNKKKINK